MYVDMDYLEGKAHCSLILTEFWYPDAPRGAGVVIGYILLDIREVGL
jgi:hypothetical protein